MLLALGTAAVLAVILFFIPDALSRLVGFGAEIAFLLIFPVFMENDFNEWQAAHPTATPSNGWNSIGMGIRRNRNVCRDSVPRVHRAVSTTSCTSVTHQKAAAIFDEESHIFGSLLKAGDYTN